MNGSEKREYTVEKLVTAKQILPANSGELSGRI